MGNFLGHVSIECSAVVIVDDDKDAAFHGRHHELFQCVSISIQLLLRCFSFHRRALLLWMGVFVCCQLLSSSRFGHGEPSRVNRKLLPSSERDAQTTVA